MPEGKTVEVIEEQYVEGKRLGRHIHFDDQSREYRITKPPAKVDPSKDVVWTRRTEPYDQGDLGYCTIEGLSGCLATPPFKFTKAQRKLFSSEKARKALYTDETANDQFDGQWPPDDTGSTTLDAAKTAVRAGLISRYEWGFSADDAVAAIFRGTFEVGVNWYEGFDNPDANGVVRVEGQVRGGHAFQILGRVHTTNHGVVWVACQSWGRTWPEHPFMGHEGRFGITDEDFHRLRMEQGELMQPIP